jgi:hypothetical protein
MKLKSEGKTKPENEMKKCHDDKSLVCEMVKSVIKINKKMEKNLYNENHFTRRGFVKPLLLLLCLTSSRSQRVARNSRFVLRPGHGHTDERHAYDERRLCCLLL